MKKKLARCVISTQVEIPGAKCGVLRTHGWPLVKDCPAPVAMNSLAATTIATQASTKPGSSHHTAMNLRPRRKWTSRSPNRG